MAGPLLVPIASNEKAARLKAAFYKPYFQKRLLSATTVLFLLSGLSRLPTFRTPIVPGVRYQIP
jgi:hypothetical protein